MSITKPKSRHVLALLLALLAVPLLVVAGALAFVQTEGGRELARERLERSLDAALPGSVHIGRLERVGWLSPVVRELEFREPGGRVVLHVERAELEVALLPLFRARLVVPYARADGGYIVIAVRPDGRTGLEATFCSPEPRLPGQPDEGAVFHFEHIDVAGLNAVLRPARDQTIKVRDVHGVVVLDRPKDHGIRVSLSRLRGRVTEPELAGERLRLVRVDGWVRGMEPQVLELAFWTKLGRDSGRIDGSLSLFDRAREPLQVRLRPHGDPHAELAAALVWLQAWAAEDVHVEIDDAS